MEKFPSNEKPAAKLGDYVTAQVEGKEESRQGVFVKDNGDGTIDVQGENDIYRCEAEGVVVVPDENLLTLEARKFVADKRRELGL
jgi:hypothetical protein